MVNIVYSNNIQRGINKLEEICKEKNNLIRKITSLNDFRYEFEDEVWRFVKPNGKARGIKYDKCYVDATTVTLEEYYNYILPSGVLTDSEKIKFFY